MLGRTSTLKLSTVQTNEKDVNCHSDVLHDRETYKMQTLLLTWINSTKKVSFLPSGMSAIRIFSTHKDTELT